MEHREQGHVSGNKLLNEYQENIAHLFRGAAFPEQYFTCLDDCRTLSRIRVILFTELCCRSVLHTLGFSYPENCLLGIFERI
jgi:hypothetical protein